MTSNAQRFWDQHAAQFDDQEKNFGAVTRQTLDLALKYLAPGDAVLDFGCATGSHTLALAPSVSSILGLDFSEEMIKEAERKKGASGAANCAFRHGTIYDSGLMPASFDTIVSFSVLHLLDDSDKAVRRIHELLKPGGLFLSTTACFRERKSFGKWKEVRAIRRQIRQGTFPLHLNFYRVSDVKKLMSDQGFRVEASQRIFSGITFSFVVGKKS